MLTGARLVKANHHFDGLFMLRTTSRFFEEYEQIAKEALGVMLR